VAIATALCTSAVIDVGLLVENASRPSRVYQLCPFFPPLSSVSLRFPPYRSSRRECATAMVGRCRAGLHAVVAMASEECAAQCASAGGVRADNGS